MTKKIWGWVGGAAAILIIAVLYVFGKGSGSSGSGIPALPPSTAGTGNGGAGSGSSGTGGQSPSYKDGTFTGPITNAIYGDMQVAVTISQGKITDVSWPAYPDAPGHTSQESQMALPQLKQETLTAQSANIDIVSGATQTSQAFAQSLAGALAQASQ